MTHTQRLAWLQSHGLIPERTRRQITLQEYGLMLWIEGTIRGVEHSLWLAVSDGAAILHGGADMTWPELQAWIEGPAVVQEPGPVRVQRQMF
jgi:hypothetical protein